MSSSATSNLAVEFDRQAGTTLIKTDTATDIHLRAVWRPNTINVTWNANGGVIEGNGTERVVPTAYGEAVTLEDAAMPTSAETQFAGYDLMGWATSATATAPDVTGTTPLPTAEGVPNHAVVYYAVWDAQPAEIQFALMGGEPECNPIVGKTGEVIKNRRMPNVSKTGYTLMGWYTADGTADADGDGAPDNEWGDELETTTGEDGSTVWLTPETMPPFTTIYYARWTPDPAEISSDYNVPEGYAGTPSMTDGSNISTWTITGMTDQEITNRSALPDAQLASPEAGQQPDYVFNGWYDNPELSGMRYTNYPETFPAGHTVMYASWLLNETTVSFMTNGGSAVPAWHGKGGTQLTYTVMEGLTPVTRPVTELPTPSRDRYTFDGWYLTPDFTGDCYRAQASSDGTVKTIYDIEQLRGADYRSLVFPQRNLVLYAKWSADTVTSGRYGDIQWSIDANGELSIWPVTAPSATMFGWGTSVPTRNIYNSTGNPLWEDVWWNRKDQVKSFRVASGTIYVQDDASNGTKGTLYKMFEGFSKMSTCDLTGLVVNSAESMENMFDGCVSLTSVTVPDTFSVQNTTSFKNMFNNCSKL